MKSTTTRRRTTADRFSPPSATRPVSWRGGKNNKSPGIDNLTAELLKVSRDNFTRWLTRLFNQIWETEDIPEDWKIGVIIPLLKTRKVTPPTVTTTEASHYCQWLARSSLASCWHGSTPTCNPSGKRLSRGSDRIARTSTTSSSSGKWWRNQWSSICPAQWPLLTSNRPSTRSIWYDTDMILQ